MSFDTHLCLTRRATLIGLALLAGCGFTPVYQTDAGLLQNATSIEVPATADGYALRQHLIDRLGHADNPTYRLRITLSVTTDQVAVTAENLSNQTQLPGEADYVLRDGTDQIVAQGSVLGFTSYSTTGSTVTTLAAAEDARIRLMVILGDMITTRILAEMAR